ncbi:hypothetical protein LMH75_028125, partial [Vibrio lentus]
YYHWLTYFFDTNFKKIFIFSEYRALARGNNKSNLIVKYLLPATRELLYRHTDSLLEEIVLRNGGELGVGLLRTEGCIWLILKLTAKSVWVYRAYLRN